MIKTIFGLIITLVIHVKAKHDLKKEEQRQLKQIEQQDSLINSRNHG